MKKVLHIISGLKVGGAEMMLLRLIVNTSTDKYQHTVVSLSPDGEMRNRFIDAGIDLIVFDFKNSTFKNFYRLISLIRRSKPDIVQTWLYHSDFLGGLATRFAGSCPVVWNIRSTSIPQGPLSITYWLVRLCAVCSYFIPDRIICCAISAKTAHVKLKYSTSKLTVIQNGYEFSAFELARKYRFKARNDLGFDINDIVIGVVGRFDPLKDFHNFVSASAFVAAKCPNVKFLMVGRDNDWSNDTLVSWINTAGLVNCFKLVGENSDVAFFLSAMDIFCLSSVVEAFPNVVVEAMATGLPCVVTHAGDAADILGDDNFVVPTNNSLLLANVLLRICYLDPVDRKDIGERNRKRVTKEYTIEKIMKKYEDVYDQVARR